MRRPGIVGSIAAVSAAAVVVVPAASAATELTRTRARAASVVTARQLCQATTWCVRSQVEPARRCERRSRITVACDIRFLAAGGAASSGLVSVRRGEGGKLEVGVAVPEEPAR